MDLIAPVVRITVGTVRQVVVDSRIPAEQIARAMRARILAGRVMLIRSHAYLRCLHRCCAAARARPLRRTGKPSRECMGRAIRIDLSWVTIPEVVLADPNDPVIASINHDTLAVSTRVELEYPARVREPVKLHLPRLKLTYKLFCFRLDLLQIARPPRHVCR
jgi:hypothetical protein